MSKAKRVLMLNDVTDKVASALEKFDAGEMPGQQFAHYIRAATWSVNLASLRANKIKDEDVRLN
jgi:hypothetical protein